MNKKNLLLTLGCLFLLSAITASASDIIEVLPLTDQIIMVHFDDGYVTHHKLGENRNTDQIHAVLLDLTDAIKVTSYELTSVDDPNYATAKNPLEAGRKSKGTDFSMNNAWNATWFTNSWVSEHWIYLKLSDKMQSGQVYTLTTSSLAANSNSFQFTYNEKTLRSEAVHVNQVGYLPSATSKFGYVYHWMGDKGGLALTEYADKAFWIVDAATEEVKFSGQLKFRAAADNSETGQENDTPYKNFLGSEVYECDFSAFTTAGKYRLAVEGIGCSFSFEIDEDIYRSPFKTTARGLFHNRSGIELTSEYTEFTRPAPHNPNITPGFAGKLRYTTVRSCDTQSDGGNSAAIKSLVESGDKGPINTWGWYQDAGDWDGYPSHLRIPALLLLAYEMAPEKFTDNELNIPGENNTVPDILDEARFLIEYLQRTRHAIMDAGYGTGGVSGRVCGDYWGSDMNSENATNGSWGDLRTWYVFGEDPMNTYMYAGLSAQYAYLLKLSDKTCPTGINWQQEAIDAYLWAKNNTRTGDENAPHAVVKLKDARMYAAVNLYKLTGKNVYHARFIKDAETVGNNTVLAEDTRLSIYSYLLLDSERTLSDDVTRFKSATSITANNNVSVAAEIRACRWGGVFYMPMLVGQGTTPWVIDALMDHRINDDAASLADAQTTLDYFMGNNPLNQIWFTGEKSDIINPDRRYATGVFHMDSWYNTAKEAREVPGYSPYGPWRQERKLTPNTNDGGGNNGWWCNEWSYISAYPPIQENPTPIVNNTTAWPGHERWFNQRYAPLSCENTVHQNTVHWAISTGLLCQNITDNPFDASRLPVAEPFEKFIEEEDPNAVYLLVANMDEKPFYSGDNFPDDGFGVFVPGGTGASVNNPLQEGINTTATVFEFTKAEGTWKVWGFEPKSKLDNLNKYTHLEFLVCGYLGSIHVIINNVAGGAAWLDKNIPVSASDAWQKVVIPLPESGAFASVLFFPNSNVDEMGATSYYDNIQFKMSSSPDTPINLNASGIANNSFTLNWDAVSNITIDKYLVFRSTAGGTTTDISCGESTTNSLVITDLEKGKSYYFAVKAVGNGQESVLSEQHLVTLTDVSIDQVSLSKFSIFPNPVISGGEVTIDGIDGKAVTVTLYNSVGGLVGREVLSSSSSITIPLTPGIYMMQVETLTYKQLLRLVVY